MLIYKFLHQAITLLTFAALASVLLFTACNDVDDTVVEVNAVHNAAEDVHLFEMSAHEIPNGWTTFQFNNASAYDHFFLVFKLPEEGIEAAEAAGEPFLDHWFHNITEPFQLAYDPYIDGDIDYDTFAENLVAALSQGAPWFFDPGAPAMGGPGFTAAGATSETTIYLDPGEYVVECYVKNEDELFHSYIGMLEHLSVTEEASGTEEPEPSYSVTISSSGGIQADQDLNRGRHTIEIFFEDQVPYAHFLGHNVQLVKLSDKEDEELLRKLANWMDWRYPGSLVNRAPEGAEFMGGTMEMTEGATAYFHVDLEMGDYAWIAEVPDPADHDMLKTFTVE